MVPRVLTAALSALLLWSLPALSFAQGRTLTIGFGSQKSLEQIAGGLVSFLGGAIVAICIAVFAIGALYYVLGAAKQDYVEKGKTMMISSLIGLAVVLGSYGIVRTVFFFLYS